MRKLFGAKANMGPAEASRRTGIAIASVQGTLPPPKELPPSLIAEPIVLRVVEPPPAPGADIPPVAAQDMAVERRAWAPDNPVLTITISGGRRSGKSVLALALNVMLGDLGLAVRLPDGQRSIRWRDGIRGLVGRNLTIELRTEDDPERDEEAGDA